METAERMSRRYGTRWKRQCAYMLAAFVIALCMLFPHNVYAFIANTTGDFGNVTVMEVDGTYDGDAGSALEVRQEIAREFYRLHRDEYDFLVIFTNFDFRMPEEEASGYYYHVRNDVKGIGLPVFDNSAHFGSAGKLQGYIDMGNLLARNTLPLDPKFMKNLNTLSHEVLHKWSSYVRFRDSSGNTSPALLGRDMSHWSYLLDSEGSLQYGNDWQDNGDGTFASMAARKYYSPLDLYLMGFIDRTQVPPMLLIESPGTDPAQLPKVGAMVQGTAHYVTIDDIIAAEGERIPGHGESQKEFKAAFIYATRPDTFSADDLYGLENIRNQWVTNFSILTDGRGIVEVASMPIADIPVNPGATLPPVSTRTLPPDINEGVAWLTQQQGADGKWLDMQQTAARDTTEAVLALQPFESAQGSYAAGLDWLSASGAENLDYLARRVESLSASGRDVSALVAELVSLQNPDGGWGSSRTYLSNPTDTSFALRALAAAGYTDQDVVSGAIDYLIATANPDGGWGGIGASNIQTTSNVLLAFNGFRKDYPLEELIESAVGWMLTKQNSDGGFGNSPSTVYDTASALLTLRELDVSQGVTTNGVDYILALQSQDGSWYESSYQTAMAVSAVWKSTMDPDLSIKLEDISFIPETVTAIPQDIVVKADVWNFGRTVVPQATVTVYDGDPSLGVKLGEQTLAFPGQAATTVTFSIHIDNGSEHYLYVILDQGGVIEESNERNNTAVKILLPETTYDFAANPDVQVSADTVEITDAVTITSSVTNYGTMNAYNVPVDYFIDLPQGQFYLGTRTIDIPAGATVISEFVWKTNKAGADLPVTISVDPDNMFAELSEDNNTAVTSVTVNQSVLVDANLLISYRDVNVVPDTVNINGDVSISAIIRNEGFSVADDVYVVLNDGVPDTDGVMLENWTIPSIAPGETLELSFTWQNITESGEHIVYLQVDPENTIVELDEEDNDAFVTLKVLSLPDLAVSADLVKLVPSAPREGENVSVFVTVLNQGDQAVSDVSLSLLHENSLVDTQTVPIVAGNNEAVVAFDFDTTGLGGVQELTVTVDADGLIIEQDEDNNTAAVSFGIAEADIWLSERYISPNGDGVQDSTRFSFRLDVPLAVQVVVSNPLGETVRTVEGFENVMDGSVVWDGITDRGTVAGDGEYFVRLLDANGMVLRSLPVIVDNNNSPLTDALGTEYLHSRDVSPCGTYTRFIQWLPDESGMLIQMWGDGDGLYIVSPDGSDVRRIVPEEWSSKVLASGGGFGYVYEDVQLSPDGKKVAFILIKYEWKPGWSESKKRSSELWVMDIDGTNLTLLNSYTFPRPDDNAGGTGTYIWSPDSRKILYTYTYNVREVCSWYWPECWKEYTVDLRVVSSDGTGDTTLETHDTTSDTYVKDYLWFSDSSRIAYVRFTSGQYSTYYNFVVSDLSGNKNENVHADQYLWFNITGWLDGQKLLAEYMEANSPCFLILDVGPQGEHRKICLPINRHVYENTISISPDGKLFAFLYTFGGVEHIILSDLEGNMTELPNVLPNGIFYEVDFIWSQDSKKVAYSTGTTGPKLFDAETFSEITYETPPYPLGVLEWFPNGHYFLGYMKISTSFLHDIYFVDSVTGEKSLLFSDVYPSRTRISPLGNYLSYERYYEEGSTCGNYPGTWVANSLLNLTARLIAMRDETAIVLRGTAQDLNFEGYVLEYAYADAPGTWHYIAPPSDTPVMDDVFTRWVPPFEGAYYVRLTVWDKAGNVTWDVKRVTWGESPLIANLYKSTESFSPNGDGVIDTVEVHYRVTAPANFTFEIYSEEGVLLKAFDRSYTVPSDDFIVWDGKDSGGSVVPDGRYIIRVGEIELVVRVDNTPPDVSVGYGPFVWTKNNYFGSMEILGHAVDDHIKGWTVEYGAGENPEEWRELLVSADYVDYHLDRNGLLAGKDADGNLLLDPLQDAVLRRLTPRVVEPYQLSDYLNLDYNTERELINAYVGKKLRITAEDEAGNKSTSVSDFPEEAVFLYLFGGMYFKIFDDERVVDKTFFGEQYYTVFETVGTPIRSINIQYKASGSGWVDGRVFESPESASPVSGSLILVEDNIDILKGLTYTLEHLEDYSARIKAVDVMGRVFYSNAIHIDKHEEGFELTQMCGEEGDANLVLTSDVADMVSITFSVQSDGDPKYADETDYIVMESETGFTGETVVPLPQDLIPGVKYSISARGRYANGFEVYRSHTYPFTCSLGSSLDITYETAACGATSHKAFASARLDETGGAVSIQSISYYLQRGNSFELIASFDNINDGFSDVPIDTSGLADGQYAIKVVIGYLELDEERILELKETLIVDSVLPNAEILYPADFQNLGLQSRTSADSEYYGIPVEAVAVDSDNSVKSYSVFYSVEGETGPWMPANTRRAGASVPLEGEAEIEGQLGYWDTTGVKETEVWLKLKVTDETGNTSCDTVSVSIDTVAELERVSTNRTIFSPNGDGVLDDVEIRYEIIEKAMVDIEVFKVEGATGSPDLTSTIRTITSGKNHLGGTGSVIWDGKDGGGSYVSDGKYAIFVFVTDSLGNTKNMWIVVTVDTTAPVVALNELAQDALGSIAVELAGLADDLHFKQYTVGAAEGSAPDAWSAVIQGSTPVQNDVLGVWNTFGAEGLWSLRLLASDLAGNTSETIISVDFGTGTDPDAPQTIILSMDVSPSLISPNGDNKLDNAYITYELTDTCDVVIEVIGTGGTVAWNHIESQKAAGIHTVMWNGSDTFGNVVDDGSYRVELTATLSSDPEVEQKESVTAIVDTTPPTVNITSPVGGSYVHDNAAVYGTIYDPRLLDYTMTYGAIANQTVLDTATRSRNDFAFGTLSGLQDGEYSIQVTARDGGENVTEQVIEFVADSTPPFVNIISPREGEYFGPANNTISIQGELEEQNFDSYVLRLGSGKNPSQWTELLSGATMPMDSRLVHQLVSDGMDGGVYTISLLVLDMAGSSGEATVKIVIDNTTPQVSVSIPGENDYVKGPVDIAGTVFDDHLSSYTVEVSEGICADAQKWSPIMKAAASVQNGSLASLMSLPPDGEYCIRVTAIDETGNKGEAIRNIRIDTQPPSAPVLSGELVSKTSAVFSWSRVDDADLAGYNLFINGQVMNAELMAERTYQAENLPHGVYRAVVTAIDHAGWESEPSNEVQIEVDLIAPRVAISSPQSGSKVNGIVEVKGTAYSAEDFREYRLYVGEGATPDTWVLLRKSPVPISYGSLGHWDTLMLAENSIYTLKLEVEDISENIDSQEVTITVDNMPPAEPVLISAVVSASDVTLTWEANAETDLVGYLLYRNDRLVNAGGSMVTMVKPYIITGTTCGDNELPDGRYYYYLVAVDDAGNLSNISNIIDGVVIDEHAPHAEIKEPMNGTVFEETIKIVAVTTDNDVDSVRFEYKPESESVWIPLGEAVRSAPYIAHFDPKVMGLNYGTYHVQAVATDITGNVDTAPTYIRVTYQDLTAPSAPSGLVAKTDGGDVSLSWSANTETDLDGYNIYRLLNGNKIKLNSSLVKEPTFANNGLSDDEYAYEVTAVDMSGNESVSSDHAHANVYAPVVAQPYTPVALDQVQIEGDNASPNSTVKIFVDRGSGPVSQGTTPADIDGGFIYDLFITSGDNIITARVSDKDGNLSKFSEKIIAVYNEPPAAPSGLSVTVDGYAANISWDANLEADLSGYNIYRNGKKLNKGSPINTYQEIAASSYYHDYYDNYVPYKAFDSYQETYWLSSLTYMAFSPQWWQIDLESPELVSRIEIDWYSDIYSAKDYEIQAWTGYSWVSLIKVEDNSVQNNSLDITPSYRTDKIRIYMTATNDPDAYRAVEIREVRLYKDNLITDTLFEDFGLEDETYPYEVTAVDYYGFESMPSEISVIVGDVVSPTAPFNLDAITENTNILLSWSANPEADLTGYNVYRNAAQGWLKINNSLITSTVYTDFNLSNGLYVYRITAVDSVGNESLPSNEASSVVDIDIPQAPANLVVNSLPEGRTLDISWEYSGSSLSGYNLYRGMVSGGPYEQVNSGPLSETYYRDTGLENGTRYYYVAVSLDAIGNESAYSNEAEGIPNDITPPAKPVFTNPTVAGMPIEVYEGATDISGTADIPASVKLFREGTYLGSTIANKTWLLLTADIQGTIYDVTVSPVGDKVLYRYYDYSTYSYKIGIYDLETGTVIHSFDGDTPVWSPDGTRISYRYYDYSTYSYRIGIYSFESGALTHSFAGDAPVWSPDGKGIAYGYYDYSTYSYRVGIYNLETSKVTHSFAGNTPVWSPDGKYIAYRYYDYSTYSYRVGIYNLATSTATHSYAGNTPVWSPDGTRIAYEYYDYSTYSYKIGIYSIESGTVSQTYDGYTPLWSPDGTHIAYEYYDYSTYSYRVGIYSFAAGSVIHSLIGESPLWSSGGKRVAYIYSGNLYVYDTDTNSEIQLTEGGNSYYFDWSPDEEKLVIDKYEGYNKNSVYTVSCDAQRNTRLVKDGLQSVDYLKWTHNGNIVFMSNSTIYSERLTGYFEFKDVALYPGGNIFSATALDRAGNRSAPSDEISVLFDPSVIPDIEISDEDIYVYPHYPIEGERATVNIVVWNRGQTDLAGIEVDIYMLDSSGGIELLSTETIASISASSGEVINVGWDSRGNPGTNRLVVIADPSDKIAELVESNNMGMKEITVFIHEGVMMTTSLNSDSFNTGDDLNIKVNLKNAGVARDVTVETFIEDMTGDIIEPLGLFDASLSYASDFDFNLTWNSPDIIAGPYRVRTVLSDAEGVVDENIVEFAILPDISIESSMHTDPVSYGMRENVFIETGIKNLGTNSIIPEMLVHVMVRNQEGAILFDEQRVITNLLPETTNTISSTWNTGTEEPGQYTAIAEISIDGEAVASGATAFTIESVVDLVGSVSVTPAVISHGENLTSEYEVYNLGNADLTAAMLRVVIMDPESQEVMSEGVNVVDLTVNSSNTGHFVFPTDEYGLKKYSVLLYYEFNGVMNLVDKASLTVQDMTPPEVSIISPETGSVIESELHLSVTAKDKLSGISEVQYQIEGFEWRLLPLANQYTGHYYITLNASTMPSGEQIIRCRAIDGSGNVSQPVSVGITVQSDSLPPETAILIGPPKFKNQESTLFVTGAAIFQLSATDNESGVDLTEYRLDGGEWMPYAPFSIGSEGSHSIGYRSTDNAGNTEVEKTLEVVIDNTPSMTAIDVGIAKHETESGDLYVTDSTMFIMTASDNLSGVSSIEYRIDGGSWIPYEAFAIGGEGEHVIGFRSVDNLGNEETEQVLGVIVDNTPPNSLVTVGEPNYESDDTLYVKSSTVYTIESLDAGAGVESMEYRLDDGEWMAYAPFKVLDEGVHSIEYRAIDNLGLEEDVKVLEVVVDDTSPVTSIEAGNPNYQAGKDLYVTSATMFTLIAVDNASGAGYTEYRIDDGAWTPYEAFAIDVEGMHDIVFRSIDNLGNEEAEKLLAVVVDNTTPETSIEVGTPGYEGSDGNLYVTESTIFTLTPSDTLSGVASTEYRIDEGEWLEYAPFTIPSEEGHTIWYRSTDNVGNVEAAMALEVIMDNTPPESTLTVGEPKYQGNALYVTSATVFTIGAEDAGSGVMSIKYRLNGGEWLEYEPFTLPYEGVHSIEYRAVDNLGLEEDAKFLNVIVDNTPPVSSIEVGTPKYQGHEDLYVTKSTVFTLIAVDNASGVRYMEYRIDGGAWAPYASFAIAAEGKHVIGFRSIDNLGQTEAEKTLDVVVDNTPPVTSVSFGEQSYQDGSEVLVSSTTLIALNAADSLSGVEGTYYRLDSETGWKTYDAPFSLSGLAYGSHMLSYYSVDNVENTEKENTVTIVHIGIDAGTTILNIPRVLVWTEDSIHTDRVMEFIEASFAGKDVYFRIVTNSEEFIDGFRSGIYNVVAIMDTKTPLDANTMRELREAVNNGMGLIVSARSNNVHPIIADILGVKFRGSRPLDIDARDMDLHESAVSEAGGLTIYSRVLKAEPDGGETVAEVMGDPGKGGNPSRPVPALVLNEYGGGRTVFAAFDIAGSASYANPAEFAALFRNCVDYVLPEEPNAGAGSIVLLETAITVHGRGLEIKATDSLAQGLTYVPLFDLAYQDLVFGAYVEDGETVSYRYFVRLPDERGQYAKTTEVSILVNGAYQPFETYGIALEVAADSESLLATSRALLADAAVLYPEGAGRINAVISELDILSAMALGSRAETEDAIRITVGAIEKILAFGFDTKELRGLLDEYLRIIEVHYTTVEDTVEVLNAGSSNDADIVLNMVGDGAGAGAVIETGGSPAVELEKAVPDYPRVLVWLNDGCGSVPSENNCVRRDLIPAAMEGIVYRIVENGEVFWRELRSDFYTDYIILGDAEVLDYDAEQELGERIFAGRGLISSHWTGSLPGELFGISAVGEAVWYDSTVEFAQSDVFAAMGMQSYGALLSIEAIEPANAVALAEGEVAVLKGAYGFGKVLYFAYDLGLSLTDSNVAQIRTVLWDSVAYVHAADGRLSGSYPYMIRPVRVSVTSPVAADVVLREYYPEGVSLIDGETGIASTDNPKEFFLHLSAGQVEHVEYYVLLPDVRGTYRMVSEAGNASASVEFVLAGTFSEMAGGIVSLLNSLQVKGKERLAAQKARELIFDVRNRAAQEAADIQLNISDILAASEIISSLNTEGIDEIRLEIDRLLGVWQQRWYIAP